MPLAEIRLEVFDLSKLNLSPAVTGDFTNISDINDRLNVEFLASFTMLSTISLSGNNITDEVAQTIVVTLLKKSPITSLDLSNNSITQNGAASLAESLTEECHLKSLKLNQNNIGNNGALAIFRALQHNRTLQSLYLTYNSITHELAKGLPLIFTSKFSNSTLQSLDISQNNIGFGIIELFSALITHTAVNSFNFLNTFSGDEVAKGIASSINTFYLKRNDNPISINLGFNEISITGISAFIPAISDGYIKAFKIQENNICNEVLNTIASSLSSKRCLLSILHLHPSRMETKLNISPLIKAMQIEHSAITDLNISNITIHETEIGELAKLLRRGLKSLNLRCCMIGDIGAEKIAAELKGNPALTSLILGGNNLKIDEHSAILNALSKNYTLTQLDIATNWIEESGITTILRILKSNRTLCYVKANLDQGYSRKLENTLIVNRDVQRAVGNCISSLKTANTCMLDLKIACEYIQKALPYVVNNQIKKEYSTILSHFYTLYPVLTGIARDVGKLCKVSALPPELWYEIFSYLTIRDVQTQHSKAL